jgi:hypothetical protein
MYSVPLHVVCSHRKLNSVKDITLDLLLTAIKEAKFLKIQTIDGSDIPLNSDNLVKFKAVFPLAKKEQPKHTDLVIRTVSEATKEVDFLLIF